jgi:hypothetical protein
MLQGLKLVKLFFRLLIMLFVSFYYSSHYPFSLNPALVL